MIDWFANLSHELATFLLAMIPVTEYRVAMPIALESYGLNFWYALLFVVLGSALPAFVFLVILDPIVKFAERHSRSITRFFNWLFEHTRTRHGKKFEIYKDLILLLLVGIPIPLTGVYTGAIAAYVFGVPIKRSLPLIVLGVIIGTLIIGGATIGLANIF